MTLYQALEKAEEEGLDLVEIAPNAVPPVCKIIDYGKYRYQTTKKERENKKAQHHSKVKEIRFKPNIDSHDLETKLKKAKEFLSKGDKVRFICTFRGRGIIHQDIGENLIQQIINSLTDIAQIEAEPKLLMGRHLTLVLSPISQKKTQKKTSETKGEESSAKS